MRTFMRVAGVAAVLLTCFPAHAQGPLRIGASLSLTGTYAKLGKNQHEGYQLCQKDLNAKGGLLGRKVEFVVYDDQSIAAHGRAALREAPHRGQGRRGDGAVLVAGHRGRGQRDGKVQEGDGLAAGRDHVDLPEGTAAEVHLHDALAGGGLFEGLLDMAVKRGLKTVAVINEDTLFSKAAAAGAVELGEEEGDAGRLPGGVPEGEYRFLGALDEDQSYQSRRARRRHLLRRRGGADTPDEGAQRQSPKCTASRSAAICRSSTTR